MGSPPAPDVASFIAAIGRRLHAGRIPFMLIGGQAVLLHGRPRLTEDIDITLGLDPAAWLTIRQACTDLQLDPLPQQLEAFVKETFVLPARHAPTGLRVDFIFSTTPYERHAIARAVRVDVGGELVPFATAEDLIIHKLFAGRPRDLEDVVGVMRRSGDRLDWRYLETWIAEFAKVPGREQMPDLFTQVRRDAE